MSVPRSPQPISAALLRSLGYHFSLPGEESLFVDFVNREFIRQVGLAAAALPEADRPACLDAVTTDVWHSFHQTLLRNCRPVSQASLLRALRAGAPPGRTVKTK